MGVAATTVTRLPPKQHKTGNPIWRHGQLQQSVRMGVFFTVIESNLISRLSVEGSKDVHALISCTYVNFSRIAFFPSMPLRGSQNIFWFFILNLISGKKITNMPESPHPRGRRRRRGKDWENPANNTTHMSKANVYNLRSTKPHADAQTRGTNSWNLIRGKDRLIVFATVHYTVHCCVKLSDVQI